MSGANGYYIYRAASKNGKYKKLKRLDSAAKISYSNKFVKPGKTYYYKVRAYRNTTNSRMYGVYTAKLAAAAIPARPTLSLAKKSSTSIRISWSKRTKISRYVIYRSTDRNGCYKKIKTKSYKSSRSWTDSKMIHGKTYYYKMRTYKTVKGKKIYGKYSYTKSRTL